jgi:hypothetical protein
MFVICRREKERDRRIRERGGAGGGEEGNGEVGDGTILIQIENIWF